MMMMRCKPGVLIARRSPLESSASTVRSLFGGPSTDALGGHKPSIFLSDYIDEVTSADEDNTVPITDDALLRMIRTLGLDANNQVKDAQRAPSRALFFCPS